MAENDVPPALHQPRRVAHRAARAEGRLHALRPPRIREVELALLVVGVVSVRYRMGRTRCRCGQG